MLTSKEHLITDILVIDNSHKSDFQPWVEAINESPNVTTTSCFGLAYCKSSGLITALLVSKQLTDKCIWGHLFRILASSFDEAFCSDQVCKKLTSTKQSLQEEMMQYIHCSYVLLCPVGSDDILVSCIMNGIYNKTVWDKVRLFVVSDDIISL